MDRRFGVCFDMDGTLLDNEPLKDLAFSQAAVRLGGLPVQGLYADVMGQDVRDTLDFLIEKGRIPASASEYLTLFNALYGDLLQGHLDPRPGAVDLVSALKAEGFRLALVSSSDLDTVEKVLKGLGMSGCFHRLITQESVARPKPDPGCYRVALRQLDLDPGEALAFEDSESGLAAARGAGIPTVCFRHAYNATHDFSGALEIITSFEGVTALVDQVASAAAGLR